MVETQGMGSHTNLADAATSPPQILSKPHSPPGASAQDGVPGIQQYKAANIRKLSISILKSPKEAPVRESDNIAANVNVTVGESVG